MLRAYHTALLKTVSTTIAVPRSIDLGVDIEETMMMVEMRGDICFTWHAQERQCPSRRMIRGSQLKI